MMDARAALEALDQKAGRVHTMADATRVYEKLLRRPESILEDDLTIVRYFHGEKTADEYAALRAKAVAGTPALPVRHTTAVQHTDDRSRRPVLQKHLNAFADQLGNTLIDVLKQTVVPLREQVTVLEARLAQLETKPFVKILRHV